MRFRALTIFALAATLAVGCNDDDYDYTDQDTFTMKEIKALVDDDDTLPRSNDWTITDSDIDNGTYNTSYLVTLIETILDEDEDRVINITFSELIKVRSEFLSGVDEGLGVIRLPKATEIRYRAFADSYFTALYLTTEEDFRTKSVSYTLNSTKKYYEDVTGYVTLVDDENDDYFDYFYGISPSAFSIPDRKGATLVLNENKKSESEIFGLLYELTTGDEAIEWGDVIYE